MKNRSRPPLPPQPVLATSSLACSALPVNVPPAVTSIAPAGPSFGSHGPHAGAASIIIIGGPSVASVGGAGASIAAASCSQVWVAGEQTSGAGHW